MVAIRVKRATLNLREVVMPNRKPFDLHALIVCGFGGFVHLLAIYFGLVDSDFRHGWLGSKLGGFGVVAAVFLSCLAVVVCLALYRHWQRFQMQGTLSIPLLMTLGFKAFLERVSHSAHLLNVAVWNLSFFAGLIGGLYVILAARRVPTSASTSEIPS